jgi:hypothetical protein
VQHRSFWLVAAFSVGILQIWDSGALAAGVLPAAFAIPGVLLPVAAVWARVDVGWRIGALAVGAALLVAARLAAPTALNALHIALLPIALYILVVDRLPRSSTGTSA